MSTSSGNRTLASAKAAKQDEFYTQLADIANELKHYKDHFKGKVVLCNCDDPFESNFFKYFAANFNTLGLKKLVTTSYAGSPIVGGQLPLMVMEGLKPHNKKEPYLVEINEVPDLNNDGAIGLDDVRHLLEHDANTSRPLKQGGDFRSPECVEILKAADIVVTNPPFSLFREYVAQLVEHGKQFLIIANKNAITYKEVFKLIKENKLWLGVGFNAGNAFFEIPKENVRDFASGVYDEKTGLVKFRNVGWFTNMDNPKRHEFIPLYKKYTPEAYPLIDNYDAINVDKVSDIPDGFDGRIGVPITFLDKYNPDQFEIVAITKTWFGAATKTYPKQIQVAKDGTTSEVTKLNDAPAVRLAKPPTGKTYYRIGKEIYTALYQRLIIKRKQDRKPTLSE
ncbi:MAG: adenine-specific methyltransferase EcoRI family protein [Fimbriimonadaceae bacterium]|nr:adenine-specific methyltransferase EcoRI family protein [Fimbriimonadaceae bacterium]